MARKTRRLFSKNAICRATGVTEARMTRLETLKVFKGIPIEAVRGERMAYDLTDALSVAIAGELFQARLNSTIVAKTLRLLRRNTLEELEAEFAAGRKYLLSVNGCQPLPRLLTHDAIYNNEGINWSEAAKHGVRVAVIDAAQAFAEFKKNVVKVTKGTPTDYLPNTPNVRAWRKEQAKLAEIERKAGTT